MSYFEFIFSGDLTPEYEEKTKLLLKQINEGFVPFKIEKYYDEDISTDKKKRTIVIVSHINVWEYLNLQMQDLKLMFVAYYKQRFI